MPSKVGSATDALIEQHPLQRLTSPSRGVSAFVHVAGLSCFAASFKYLVDYPNPANEAYGWHFIYLTIVGLTLTTSTFLAGIIADITLSRRIFLLKNVLSFCSAPLELLITLLYWSLRVIDKRLVLPPWADLGQWADLGFHLVPIVMLVIDLLFLSPPWTMGVVPAFIFSGGIAFAYWFWLELCFAHNGWYPYPLLEMLATPYRIVLFAGSALVMVASGALLNYVYSRVNRQKLHRTMAPQTKSAASKKSR